MISMPSLENQEWGLKYFCGTKSHQSYQSSLPMEPQEFTQKAKGNSSTATAQIHPILTAAHAHWPTPTDTIDPSQPNMLNVVMHNRPVTRYCWF